jgi:hypothetical protein
MKKKEKWNKNKCLVQLELRLSAVNDWDVFNDCFNGERSIDTQTTKLEMSFEIMKNMFL